MLFNDKPTDTEYRSLIFTKPVEVVACFKPSQIDNTFRKIEQRLHHGFYSAGFFSYECGKYFENTAPKEGAFDFPLLWFGIYKKCTIFDHKKEEFVNNKHMNKLFEQSGSLSDFPTVHPEERSDEGSHTRDLAFKITNLRVNLTNHRYIESVKQIKNFIACGDTYQVNYTFKYKFNFKGNPLSLFLQLCRSQPVSYAAFIRTGKFDILSLSPELFFRRKNNEIWVKPMKGTIARGKITQEDGYRKKLLENSQKEKAENVMIVDLLRNDLGRISKSGTVKTERLFEVEKYKTLFQMTSTIKAILLPKIGFQEIFKNIFPSGSVTGAPKISTMKIIERLEKEPRFVYTGSIGYMSPESEGIFNVAIRTLLLDRERKSGEMGIGSGITYSSNADKEYKECLLKSNFLTYGESRFSLIETMLWENGRYFLLDLHLKRLRNSALYFEFPYNQSAIKQQLKKISQSFEQKKIYRLRLLLNEEGRISLKTAIIEKQNLPRSKSTPKVRHPDKRHPAFCRDYFKRGLHRRGKITFSKISVDSQNRFLYHKTTNRRLFDKELKKAKSAGFSEIIFANEQGEITEGAISNIAAKFKGQFFTPPIRCGLLNGVLRQHLFKTGFPIKEKILYKKDLFQAEAVFLMNSVRGMIKVLPAPTQT